MGDIIKLAIVLLIVASIAGVAISFTNRQTAPHIKAQKKLAEESALKMVFPKGTNIVEQNNEAISKETFWIGKKGDKTVGYAFKGSSYGFSSNIQFIVGVTLNGDILGLKILDQKETPGLGTRIEETVSDKLFWNGLFAKQSVSEPWFATQFKNLSVKKQIGIGKCLEWHTLDKTNKASLCNQNCVSGLTGATISTKAICSGVKKVAYRHILALQKEHKYQVEDINSQDNIESDTTETKKVL